MIFYITAANQEDLQSAEQALRDLAGRWDQPLTAHLDVPAAPDRDGKILDPVSLLALIVSLPSAALAVIDLTDRITKRRRAQQLIDHSAQLADHNITINVLVDKRPRPLAGLTPDQLLELNPAPPRERELDDQS